MSKPRRKPTTNFLAFLVDPAPDFQPTNWQQVPKHYRILEFVGPKHFKGRADAWKFLHNHDQLNQDKIQTWAIYLDLDSPETLATPIQPDVTLRRQNLTTCETC